MKEIPDWKGRYLPWIGTDFDTQTFWPGVRLLVLGESHYFGAPEHDVPTATRDLIGDAIKPNVRPYPYFERLPAILAGKALAGANQHVVDERAGIWQAIAFENISQEAADPATRRPSPQALERGKPALYQLVRHLRPTHILFVSKRAWDGTSYDDQFRFISSESFVVRNRKVAYDIQRASIRDVAFWATYILHPTSTRPPVPISQSHEVVQRLLAMPA